MSPISPARASVIQGSFSRGRPCFHPPAAQRAAAQSAVQRTPVARRHGQSEAFPLPANLPQLASAGGQPLPSAVREKMESAFRTSFADVRVHVGAHAAAIGAVAFNGRFVVYRAVSRYHPNFSRALQGNAMPLGTGGASFDTGASAWTAWQWNLGLAESIAASASGMGLDDRIELQSDYTRDDAYEVGVILETVVSTDDEVCFFNATEMQIKGQVHARVKRVIHMGTRLEHIDALQHYATKSRTKISHLMPEVTRKQQDDLVDP